HPHRPGADRLPGQAAGTWPGGIRPAGPHRPEPHRIRAPGAGDRRGRAGSRYPLRRHRQRGAGGNHPRPPGRLDRYPRAALHRLGLRRRRTGSLRTALGHPGPRHLPHRGSRHRRRRPGTGPAPRPPADHNLRPRRHRPRQCQRQRQPALPPRRQPAPGVDPVPQRAGAGGGGTARRRRARGPPQLRGRPPRTREPLEASVSLYHRRFADFIHGADDSSRFSHDREADGLAGAAACSTDLADFDNDAGEFDEALPCLFYRQADARFSGVEAELTLPITTSQTLGLWADQVRARLDDGGDGPRIPPLRVGAHWDYSQGPWSARLSVTRAADQDRAGANQTATDGYTRVDAFVRYGQGGWALFLKGFNLTDADIRNATSFLREIAPEPGRG